MGTTGPPGQGIPFLVLLLFLLLLLLRIYRYFSKRCLSPLKRATIQSGTMKQTEAQGHWPNTFFLPPRDGRKVKMSFLLVGL